MLWLDHLLFGNGHGMKSPYWDNKFYWLSGRLYTFFPGFGSQLTSFQWVSPKVGELRMLNGRRYKPFGTERKWFRVRVTWETHLPDDLIEKNNTIRQIKQELDNI